ncbi:MAG: hemolysin III family protein [Xanthomonadales bacterium]|nr:hemolysin III family protein [Gammaproteobacteria bacterium]MBT8050196.1 hemolysin III family protein [Gammaproteobacteria bacterium]MBT8055623.1 hemolysin III family protein [Gammaproteobacteria bacterium]NNJ79594.1 hemolysin III family protein [Xanthomonadales bacterium]NNL05439.1 hemolysin III family protein [Xanthomonadales bacterium]
MGERERQERIQTRGEEIANAASHGFGLLAAVIAAPFMIASAAERGTLADVVGVSIFAATIMFMYATSTIYHAVPHPSGKKLLRLLDHNAIYLLIAGTYTPIVLGVLYGAWGWTLFGLVWGLALAGIVLKTVSGQRFHTLTIGIYVAMGWIVVIAVKPLFAAMAPAGIAWLVAGGVAYTGGIWFYRHKEMPFSHFIWHLFVLAGTFCHVVAIMGYGI